MIILSPYDADVNGAPNYYVTGNWRPRISSSTEQKDSGSIHSVPLDWCDKVLEYDIRFGGKPNAGTQPTAWSPQPNAAAADAWTQEDLGGSERSLRLDVANAVSSFWQAEATLTANPDRVVAYATFMVDSFGGSSNVESGFEMRAVAAENASTLRGVRGVWTNSFNYVKLATATAVPVSTTVPIDDVTANWHRVAFDAPVVGGSNTILSLDDSINIDTKATFGSVSNPGGTKLFARFGKVLSGGSNDAVTARIRNFVASAPNRFVRAWFRAFATGTTMTLRLVLVPDTFLPVAGNNAARIKVRWASRPAASNPFAVPSSSSSQDIIFTTANTVKLVDFSLTGLTAGQPMWFTVEREFGIVSNETKGTVHLLQAIIVPPGS